MLRWMLIGAVVATVCGSAAGVQVYVDPQVDSLRRADAIFVLGGPGHDRYNFGLELARQGLAGQVVLSTPSASEPWLASICGAPYGFTVSCFKPSPETTAGEVKELSRRAAEEGWHSVIVVTFTPHISRARYMIQHCFHGEVIMVASPAEISPAEWVWQYVYQTAGYVRAVIQPAC
ncbi:YdcF family protein [Rhodococcus sp. NPDC127528]|uniref:YdcF family protein n=1 Tax=unclassified Rhodococcus (in: high G+C Gram-positive bacteria) TaxID=192944 RepID=UPI00362BE15A